MRRDLSCKFMNGGCDALIRFAFYRLRGLGVCGFALSANLELTNELVGIDCSCHVC